MSLQSTPECFLVRQIALTNRCYSLLDSLGFSFFDCVNRLVFLAQIHLIYTLGIKLKCLNDLHDVLPEVRRGKQTPPEADSSDARLFVCGQLRHMNLSPDSWNALGLVQGIWQNVTANLIQGEALEHRTTTSDLQFHEVLKQLLHCAITFPLVTLCLLALFLSAVLNLWYFLALLWHFPTANKKGFFVLLFFVVFSVTK